MLVTAHKREEDWPAPLALDEETVFMMEVFLDKVRPVVTNDKTPSSLIFLMSDGQPFVPGTIGKRISSFTVKSGVRSNTTDDRLQKMDRHHHAYKKTTRGGNR